MGRFSKAKVERCSGGFLTDSIDGVTMVAVVHRPRHDDWTLPKGHVDDGESWKQAALREVAEETGVTAQIAGEPCVIGYMVGDDLPKIVLFYPMVPRRGEQHSKPDPDEVDAVEWWPLHRAMSELTYADERGVVAEFADVAG